LPPEASGKPRGTLVDPTSALNERGQGLGVRLVLHRVPQHPRPLGSRHGDAMRYLNVEGKIAWKASPWMLSRLADAEREVETDLP
jgi:hypothetical protein